jgi:putative hydrolase of the HAD superfamily
MAQENTITTLFLDIGGVLLSDGWGRESRKDAASFFDIQHDDMEERHHLTFDTYELWKMFYEKRSFSYHALKEFMHAQSKPYPEMIKIISRLKKQYGLKLAAVSNEGRELNDNRIKKFKLNDPLALRLNYKIFN